MTIMDFDAPREYDRDMPMFDADGRITERVDAGVENVLAAYVEISKLHAKATHNNPLNYAVSEIRVAGSGARENKVESDLDLLLMAPKLDKASAKAIQVPLAMIYFTDRPKWDAVDPSILVSPKDVYEDRPTVNITPQVSGLIKRYNALLE